MKPDGAAVATPRLRDAKGRARRRCRIGGGFVPVPLGTRRRQS